MDSASRPSPRGRRRTLEGLILEHALRVLRELVLHLADRCDLLLREVFQQRREIGDELLVDVGEPFEECCFERVRGTVSAQPVELVVALAKVLTEQHFREEVVDEHTGGFEPAGGRPLGGELVGVSSWACAREAAAAAARAPEAAVGGEHWASIGARSLPCRARPPQRRHALVPPRFPKTSPSCAIGRPPREGASPRPPGLSHVRCGVGDRGDAMGRPG